MIAINDIPETPELLDGNLTDLLHEVNDRFAAVARNFDELRNGSTGGAQRTLSSGVTPRNPYSYVNPVINVYDFLDPLYAKLRTAAMQVRELNMLPNSVGQNQLQIDSVIARHIVAGSVTADKIDVNELSAIVANIGTITAGNITLDTAGFIRGGATSFEAGVGFWMGYDSGAYKFFLGNSGGDFLSWDGSTLTLSSGSIPTTIDWADVTGAGKPADNATVGATWGVNLGSIPTELTDNRIPTAINSAGLVITGVKPGINVTTGSAGLYLGADFLGYYSGAAWSTYMDNAGNFYLGGTSGALQWNGTTLTIVGNGTFSGSLSAAAGTFVGSLTAATGTFAGSLSAATGTFAGNLSAAGGTFTGALSAATGSFAGSLSAATGSFAGSLSAATGSFSGTITASAGTIGGFTLGASSLTAGSGATSVGIQTTTIAFFAGNATPGSAPFRVGTDGSLVATNATITGGGTFSGALSSATGTFAGSLSAATGSFSGSLSAATGSFAGSLSAATGSFSGTVTASAGTIAGFTLASSTLTAGTGQAAISLNSSTSPHFRIGDTSAYYAEVRGTSVLLPQFNIWDGGISLVTITANSISDCGVITIGNSAGASTITLFGSDGSVSCGSLQVPGFANRPGTSGSPTSNRFNLYWDGNRVRLWIDVTDLGAIPTVDGYNASALTPTGYIPMTDSTGTVYNVLVG